MYFSFSIVEQVVAGERAGKRGREADYSWLSWALTQLSLTVRDSLRVASVGVGLVLRVALEVRLINTHQHTLSLDNLFHCSDQRFAIYKKGKCQLHEKRKK